MLQRRQFEVENFSQLEKSRTKTFYNEKASLNTTELRIVHRRTIEFFSFKNYELNFFSTLNFFIKITSFQWPTFLSKTAQIYAHVKKNQIAMPLHQIPMPLHSGRYPMPETMTHECERKITIFKKYFQKQNEKILAKRAKLITTEF